MGDPLQCGTRCCATTKDDHLFHARRFKRALEEVERVRELDPEFADMDIFAIHSLQGRYEDAYRERIAFFKQCGARCGPLLAIAARGYAEGGWVASRRATVEVLAKVERFSPMALAINYTWIGETEKAFASLERAYELREPSMIYLKWNPDLDSIRSDPRFDDLVRRVGFPES